MSRYLVDTNWLIDFLRGSAPAISLLESLKSDGIAISVITYAELLEGVLSYKAPGQKARETDLRNLGTWIDVVPVDRAIAERLAEIRSSLRRSGRPIGDFDLIIAATAISRGLTLVTRDRSFGRVPGLKQL